MRIVLYLTIQHNKHTKKLKKLYKDVGMYQKYTYYKYLLLCVFFIPHMHLN